VSLYPNSRNLWELAAESAGDPETELKIYREMSRRFPAEPGYKLALAQVLIDTDDLAEARKILLPLITQGTADFQAKAHFHLARCALAEKESALALKHLKAAGKASSTEGENTEAMRLRAQAHVALKQLREAIEDYHRALRNNPTDADILLNLIRLESQLRHRDKALDYLRRYTVVAGNDPDRVAEAAQLHYAMGRLEDACELAERVVATPAGEKDEKASTEHSVATAHRILGLIKYQRHQYAVALEHLKHADLDAEALAARLRSHLALGHLHEAQLDMAKVQDFPSDRQLQELQRETQQLLSRRALLTKEKQIAPAKTRPAEQALDAIVCAEHAYDKKLPRTVIEKLVGAAFVPDVELGPAYSLRGLIELEQGHVALALADGNKAVALSPTETRAFLVRGRARLERDDPGALADLERAATLSQRKDANVLHWLAVAQARSQRSVNEGGDVRDQP
jgi:FimV-like protein